MKYLKNTALKPACRQGRSGRQALRMTVVLLCVGVILLLCSAPLFLVAQNLKATATIDTNTILIGDQVHLHLKAEYPTGKLLNWPLIGDTIIKQIEVVERSKIDTNFSADLPAGQAGRRNTILSQTLTITAFDSGYFVIPPFQFSIGGDTSSQAGNIIETGPLSLTVQTVEVDTTLAIKDIKAPMEIPFALAEIWLFIKEHKWWFIIGGILLIGIVLLIIYLRRPKEIIQIKKPKIPPHIIALEKLKELENNPEYSGWEKSKVKLYYSKLTEIVRIYIEDRFNIIAMELTTDEILANFKHVDINTDTRGKLKQMLSLADMVKFAKANPIVSEHELCLSNAYDFVKKTIPVENEQVKKDREDSFNRQAETTS